MALTESAQAHLDQLRRNGGIDEVVACAWREVERRKVERREAQKPYDGPNRRSRTSRHADDLEDLSERERQCLIESLFEDSINEA